jgi:acylphosphatase
MQRWRIRITGRVQGVGFRWFTTRAAERLLVAGFVRNERDGSVVCEAEAAKTQLDAFVAALRRGPPAAHVDDLQCEPMPPRGDSGFAVQ